MLSQQDGGCGPTASGHERDAASRTGTRRAHPPARPLRGTGAIGIFAIPWTAFALFREIMARSPRIVASRPGSAAPGTILAGIVLPVFGVPFVPVGVWMPERPVALMHRAGRTAYAVTDRRPIRRVEGRTIEIESIPLDRLGAITRHDRRDGSGDLSVRTGNRVPDHFHIHNVADVAAVRWPLAAHPTH